MDLTVSRMMELQRDLYELHKDTWSARMPESGREHILYMIEEIGETIAVLKKKGNEAVMEDREVRAAFLEEMADVLMYYTDVLLCYQVTPEELARAYQQKHDRNMDRNYTQEYKELYHNG